MFVIVIMIFRCVMSSNSSLLVSSSFLLFELVFLFLMCLNVVVIDVLMLGIDLNKLYMKLFIVLYRGDLGMFSDNLFVNFYSVARVFTRYVFCFIL